MKKYSNVILLILELDKEPGAGEQEQEPIAQEHNEPMEQEPIEQ